MATTVGELPDGFVIGPMRPGEETVLDTWAAAEGWNPGDGDIAVAHGFDPDAFIALRRGDELIGGGTILSYGGRYGFMGLFIVRPEFRGEGLGTVLWHQRLRLLRARLDPDMPIGMDGVFDMVPFYERGGFRLAYRDLRFGGTASGEVDPAVVPIGMDAGGGAAGFDAVDAYDRRHVPAPRTAFLRAWLDRPGVRTGALVEDGALVGYAALRRCRDGHRFGPVLAERPDVAERLVATLAAGVAGQRLQLDVPEANDAALALAGRFGLVEEFGCARLYHGPAPQVPVGRVFGVTSFEFG
jgi:GNAT superfamily N-acetyltransferase